MLATSGVPRSRRTGQPLPSMFVFTDDERGATPLELGLDPPLGTAVILRSRHRAGQDWQDTAEALDGLGFEVLLSATDPTAALSEFGIHIPEASVANWRQKDLVRLRPRLVTASAHSLAACARAAKLGVDLVFVSPVFATQSHPGAKYLGLWRLGTWTRRARVPVAALGGIKKDDLRRVAGLGIAAIGGIGLFAKCETDR